MPTAHAWTEGQDTQIRRLRTEGAEWDLIAQTLGLTRWAIVERARRLGVSRRLAEAAQSPVETDRPALPAGHPHSWGAINAGTALENTPFKIPSEIR